MRAMFERITGEPAVMWGPSMVGFGSQAYTNTTGTNDWFIVGFSPRSTALTIYGIHEATCMHLPRPTPDDLGPHYHGQVVRYVKRLDAIDGGVLEQLVHDAWQRGSGDSSPGATNERP